MPMIGEQRSEQTWPVNVLAFAGDGIICIDGDRRVLPQAVRSRRVDKHRAAR